jgi:hypothetical protein
MFIKIFTPNENGKIELTVKELEALIQEAVDKANIDKCNKCTRGWSWNDYNRLTTTPSITLLGNNSDNSRRNGEITWDANKAINCNYDTNAIGDLCTPRPSINEQLNFDFDNIKEN